MKKTLSFIFLILAACAVFAQTPDTQSVEPQIARELLLNAVKGTVQFDLYQVNSTRDQEIVTHTICSAVLVNHTGLIAIKPDTACLHVLSEYKEHIPQTSATVKFLDKEYNVASFKLFHTDDYATVKFQGVPGNKIQTLANGIFKLLHQPDLTTADIKTLLYDMPDAQVTQSTRPYMDSWED